MPSSIFSSSFSSPSTVQILPVPGLTKEILVLEINLQTDKDKSSFPIHFLQKKRDRETWLDVDHWPGPTNETLFNEILRQK